jgi:hypothetical protein
VTYPLPPQLGSLTTAQGVGHDHKTQAGMLVLQLKQVVPEDKRFSKSIINGFQLTTELQERIVVVS